MNCLKKHEGVLVQWFSCAKMVPELMNRFVFKDMPGVAELDGSIIILTGLEAW